LEKKDDALSKLEKELKELLNDVIEQAEKLPPGLAKKDEMPGNADKAFEEIVGMLNDIDKMVNGLGKEDDAEESKGFGDFVSSLKSMFSDVDGSTGNDFLKNLHKVADKHGASAANQVGKATIQAETLSGLLKGGHADSSSGIHRVGDGGEGSGNFTATNFMADMSSKGVSNGLDSYRNAKEAREEATENQAKQTGAVAELSEVA